MAVWAGVLSFRHSRLFKGLADLWQPTFPVGATGGTATSWALATSAVPYVLDRKSAVETPWLIGAIEGEDMITTDTMRFPPGTVFGSHWIIVDRSITITGAEGENFNGGWAVKGDPVRDDNLDLIRRAGMVEAYTTRLSKLPPTLVSYYA